MKPNAITDKKSKKDRAIAKLLEQRRQLAALIDQARWSPKLKERKWGKNLSSSHSFSKTAVSTTNTAVTTDHKSDVRDNEDVEMKNGDEGWDVPDL